MSGEVVSLGKVGTVIPGTAVPGVVEMLQRWLAMAERGEVVHVAIAGLDPCGGSFTGWEGAMGLTTTMGVVAALQARLAAKWMED